MASKTVVYKNLKFPQLSNRPYFYADFVSTIDGKVKILTNPQDYWPIGSAVDYQAYMQLRSFADAIIHGTNTATVFGQKTIESLTKKEFIEGRKKLGKKKDLQYIILSNNPTKKLFTSLKNAINLKILLITNEKAAQKLKIPSFIEIQTAGREKINLGKLSSLLFKQGYKSILLEGGPRLLTSFLKEKLVDEIFLTIAPRIYGGKKNEALTMVEDHLFPSATIKCKLISVQQIGNELFLRYKIVRT